MKGALCASNLVSETTKDFSESQYGVVCKEQAMVNTPLRFGTAPCGSSIARAQKPRIGARAQCFGKWRNRVLHLDTFPRYQLFVSAIAADVGFMQRFIPIRAYSSQNA